MNLGEYLATARLKPWAWGVHDCCAFPARWAGAPLPDYSNEAEAEAMLRNSGGLLSLFARAAAGVAEPVETQLSGDVGVIELITVNGEPVEVGAIFTGRRWAFVPMAGGIAACSAIARQAWRPHCLRR